MPIYPKVGAHISAAVDVSQAPLRAREAGCECFQLFSRPPQGGPTKELTEKNIKEFKANCKKYQLESYIHSPYYINLASAKNNIYYGSISALREELERGSLLGVKYMMAHLGSAKDLGEKEGLKKVVEGLEKILTGYKGQTGFLIEMSAGAGAIIGDTFEEIAKIIDGAERRLSPPARGVAKQRSEASGARVDERDLGERSALTQDEKRAKASAEGVGAIGICFDTCHAFASGYDLRTEKAVKDTFKKFDKVLGLKRLRLIHANDSQTKLGSHKDRHEHIGQGQIGLEGFKAIVKFAKKQKINLILETPHDKRLTEDLKILKKMRK